MRDEPVRVDQKNCPDNQAPQAAASEAVKALVQIIVAAASDGEAVRVFGFGTFAVARRPARRGRNPQTGESVEIAASSALRFSPGKAVKDRLNPRSPPKVSGGKAPPATNRSQ